MKRDELIEKLKEMPEHLDVLVAVDENGDLSFREYLIQHVTDFPEGPKGESELSFRRRLTEHMKVLPEVREELDPFSRLVDKVEVGKGENMPNNINYIVISARPWQ